MKDEEKLTDDGAQKVIASAETLFKMVKDQIWAKKQNRSFGCILFSLLGTLCTPVKQMLCFECFA